MDAMLTTDRKGVVDERGAPPLGVMLEEHRSRQLACSEGWADARPTSIGEENGLRQRVAA
jgi:hypothetical protein